MDNTFYKELCRKEAVLVEKLRVLRDFKTQFYTAMGEELPFDEEVKPTLYQTKIFSELEVQQPPAVKKTYKKSSKNMTISDKVLHALSLIGTGKTKDVSIKMIEVFPEYQKKPQKAIADARYHISDLKQAGKIEVIEDAVGSAGKTYKYQQ